MCKTNKTEITYLRLSGLLTQLLLGQIEMQNPDKISKTQIPEAGILPYKTHPSQKYDPADTVNDQLA